MSIWPVSSIIDILVEADGPQRSAEKVVRLSFQDGLRGSGQPVLNALTVNGETVEACNTFEASVTIRFRADKGRFIRGNPNDDGRVDISDAVWILGELFLGTTKTTCLDFAGANDDSRIDITDSFTSSTFSSWAAGRFRRHTQRAARTREARRMGSTAGGRRFRAFDG